MTTPGSIEYRVRKVERFIVTRYEDPGTSIHSNSFSRQIGNEFSNADTAYEVGYALARQEAEMKGYGPGDMRLIYPEHPKHADATEAVDPDPFNMLRSGQIAA